LWGLPVIKDGWLEISPFIDDFPSYKPPFIEDVPLPRDGLVGSILRLEGVNMTQKFQHGHVATPAAQPQSTFLVY